MLTTKNLTIQVLQDPASFEDLEPQGKREVLNRLVPVTAAVIAHLLADLHQNLNASQETAQSDRLLPLREIAKRLSCSERTVLRRWDAGLYPFILKDGGRLVGSEKGLERWIEARTKRQTSR
jgi:predicted DNA-binding transcriptional regulator AlpA